SINDVLGEREKISPRRCLKYSWPSMWALRSRIASQVPCCPPDNVVPDPVSPWALLAPYHSSRRSGLSDRSSTISLTRTSNHSRKRVNVHGEGHLLIRVSQLVSSSSKIAR